ncbi:TRAP transporter small permease [Falsirhodobacter sp. 20TX0035]|uniref:TRAP transporter small permease n=1 Tax=Falsirhodobacter sp. 20TX0035 TaxID=3022019 RepID=UPI00232F2AF3|nr:TRAP transporter small permease [Falsirhodobacter sp. 20TX0035]MDB6452858.1 TRAP transporter small permease [Falsirhodobacter sp. 20TX0035]
MHGRLAAFSRLNTRLSRASLWLAGLGLVAMTAIVFAQVFVRYVLNDSLLWVEPAALLLMSWFIFLGAAVGVHEAFHMGFDILVHFVPPRVGQGLRLISDLAVLAFSVAMVVFGWQLMAKTWGSSLPIIRLPGGFTYMPLFAGGILMTLFTLEHALNRLTGRPVEPDHPTPDDILQSEA